MISVQEGFVVLPSLLPGLPGFGLAAAPQGGASCSVVCVNGVCKQACCTAGKCTETSNLPGYYHYYYYHYFYFHHYFQNYCYYHLYNKTRVSSRNYLRVITGNITLSIVYAEALREITC